MSKSNKISIKFFNDHEIRAIWDEKTNRWLFNVVDTIAAIRKEADYSKNKSYWKYLKNKLKNENNKLVSDTI